MRIQRFKFGIFTSEINLLSETSYFFAHNLLIIFYFNVSVTYKENDQVKIFSNIRLRIVAEGATQHQPFKTLHVDPKNIRIYPAYHSIANPSTSSIEIQNSNLALVIIGHTEARILKHYCAPINLGNGDEFKGKYTANMNYLFVSGFHMTAFDEPLELYSSGKKFFKSMREKFSSKVYGLVAEQIIGCFFSSFF